MTDPDPIEAALRRAAPDEPAAMPPLAIDEVATTAVVSATVGRRAAGRGARQRAGAWPLALVGAIVVALVAWQLTGSAGPGPSSSATPAPVSSIPSGPSAAPETLATFNEGEFSFDYPASWQKYNLSFPIGTLGSTLGMLGTVDLGACAKSVDLGCANAAQLKPGDVLVSVARSVGVGSILDLAPPGGFTEFIDGMPAVVKSIGLNPPHGADQGRDWQIGVPGRLDAVYHVSGLFREPGVDRLADQLDALVRSIRFDPPPLSMPTDAASIDALVATAVDALDRERRGPPVITSYYACFPRHVGTSAPTVIADGPGGPLVHPIRVTCTVSMQAEPIGLFLMTLAASWEAGRGYAAGTYSDVVNVTPDGRSVGGRFGGYFPATEPLATP